MKLATAAKKNPTVLSIVVIRTAKNVEGNDVERGRNRKKNSLLELLHQGTTTLHKKLRASEL